MMIGISIYIKIDVTINEESLITFLKNDFDIINSINGKSVNKKKNLIDAEIKKTTKGLFWIRFIIKLKAKSIRIK